MINRRAKIALIVLIAAALVGFSGLMAPFANAMPFQNVQLVNPTTLTIKGSSAVYPIAAQEADVFPTYWNSIVAANPSWGANQCTQPIALQGLGSGTAISALIAGSADIGEMSRPPNNNSDEWFNAAMINMQVWAIGIDSVAIVTSPDMTWFPTNLKTSQITDLFAAHPSTGGSAYVTYGDFFTAQGISTTGVPAAALSTPINRAVKDPTSGTFDCFNAFFGKPNGVDFSNLANLAPYTYSPDYDVINNLRVGNLAQNTEYVGFISLGYLQIYTDMIPINISFNIANPPVSTTSVVTPAVWGPYITPNRANVIYAISGIQGTSSTGQYWAWRYLWEVTPATIPSTGPLLETGVWIAYMRSTNTTNLSDSSKPFSGSSSFVNDQAYIEMISADLAGTSPIDGALKPHGVSQGLLSTQTQAIPDGKVNFRDIVYFVQAYIAYYNQHIYNPYVDIDANGRINFNDLVRFVSCYEHFIFYNTP